MTERMLIRIERRHPDILTMESRVKGLHYLYEASPSQIVVAPSGKALAAGISAVKRLLPVMRRALCRVFSQERS